MDTCDLVKNLRAMFFAKDRDVSLQSGRKFFLGDGTELLPAGVILMWSGSVASIPAGFALCDGTAGTPDLRSKFICGAGGALSPGDTGGADVVDISHAHTDGTLAATSAGAHTHPTDVGGSHSHDDGTLAAASAGGHTHGPGTLSTGGETPQEDTSGGLGSGVDLLHTHNVAYGVSASGGGHSHDVTGSSGSAGSHSHTATSAGSHSHPVSGSTSAGGDTTHDNRPAFFAVCFLMKT